MITYGRHHGLGEGLARGARMITYGQIAYEAYCANTPWKSLINGAPLTPWVELKPAIQAAWEAAAAAVRA